MSLFEAMILIIMGTVCILCGCMLLFGCEQPTPVPFQCNECNKVIPYNQVYSDDCNKIYCKEHYDKRYIFCQKCYKEFPHQYYKDHNCIISFNDFNYGKNLKKD